jgi:hypothetical protein
MSLDFTQVVPVDQMRGDDDEDTALLKSMATEAREYLSSFAWCSRILRQWFGTGVGGVVAVFLFELESSNDDVPPFVWIVVGDVPPAYLVTDDLETAPAALGGYVEEMRVWVERVREGGSLEDVIPVNAPPTRENADKLESRLNTIETEILRTEEA